MLPKKKKAEKHYKGKTSKHLEDGDCCYSMCQFLLNKMICIAICGFLDFIKRVLAVACYRSCHTMTARLFDKTVVPF